MQTFASTRDAKEFLIARIVAEAAREGVLLSETERKMLYFSETGTLPDIMEVNDAFERKYEQEEYEEKVGGLAQSYREWAGKADPSELEAWDEAVRAISDEDHYLLVLLNARKRSADSPLADRLKLIALAFLIVVVLLAAEFLLRRR
jgi:hypothetical protein